MPFVKAKSQQHDYDVIVVGSGAAGGQSAYTLCMDGAKVLMLEAGRRYNPATETPMFQTPDQAPLRGVGTPQKPFGFYDATVDGGSEGLETTPDSSPGCLLPPPKPLVSDLLVAQRARRLGIAVIPGHKAVLTRPLDFTGSPARLHPGNVTAQRILAEDMRARAVCLWATPCGRGCSIRANY